MSDYILHISSFEGLVPGARHFRGRVEGEHPKSCHGGTVFHGWDGPLKGKTTCAEDHILPEQVRWVVEAPWTEERYQRWIAAKFEGPGPEQMTTEQEVIDVAVQRFLGQLPVQDWENPATTPGDPGDKLWAGWVSRPQDQDLVEENWGTVLAVVPAEEVSDDGVQDPDSELAGAPGDRAPAG
jgi:hypothetical protein